MIDGYVAAYDAWNECHPDNPKYKNEAMSENKIIEALTSVMREADKTFETSGGSTRHYVRDCLLPMLEEKGVRILLPSNPDLPITAKGEAERRLDLPPAHGYGKDSAAAKYVEAFVEGALWQSSAPSPSPDREVGGDELMEMVLENYGVKLTIQCPDEDAEFTIFLSEGRKLVAYLLNIDEAERLAFFLSRHCKNERAAADESDRELLELAKDAGMSQTDFEKQSTSLPADKPESPSIPSLPIFDYSDEVDRLRDLIVRVAPYIRDMQSDNIHDPSVGIRMDYELGKLDEEIRCYLAVLNPKEKISPSLPVEPEKVLRWVRSSERVPKIHKPVIVRNRYYPNIVTITKNIGHPEGWDTSSESFWAYDDTEWLEETDQPQATQVLPDPFVEWLDKEIAWNENMVKSVPAGISPSIFEARVSILEVAKLKYKTSPRPQVEQPQALPIEDKQIHVNLPNGGVARVNENASPELLGALDKMLQLAKENAPIEEGADQVIEDAVFWNRRCVELTNELSSLRTQLQSLTEELEKLRNK